MFKFLRELTKVLVEQNRIRSREVEARLHGDKRRVYKEALDGFWRIMDRARVGGEPSKRDLAALTESKRDLMLFASGEVIRLWNELEAAALREDDEDTPGRERLLRFDRIMRAMREDLGYDDSELAEGQLFALAIRGDDKDSLLNP